MAQFCIKFDPLQFGLCRDFVEFANGPVRLQEAYAIVKEAEKHLAHANDYWEECCSVLRMLKPAN